MLNKVLTAYHEAGHVVLGIGARLSVVSVKLHRRDEGWSGETQWKEEGSKIPGGAAGLRRYVVVLAGGAAAAEIVYGQPLRDDSERDDVAQMSLIADVITKREGRLAALDVLWNSGRSARGILRQSRVWKLVQRVATSLLANEQLGAGDVRRITRGHFKMLRQQMKAL